MRPRGGRPARAGQIPEIASWRAFAAVLVLGALGTMLSACSSTPGPPPASLGTSMTRRVPTSIEKLPLTDQHGTTLSLSAFTGKTVMVVPFLTLCTDICPMTTGNLLQVEQALRADKAASKVEILELSVDPGRDSPARLAAYARLSGASWALVTETPPVLAEVAHYFGFVYQKVAEGYPPATDWWTGEPLTYDVDHSDGYALIDPDGRERFVTGAAPAFHGRLVSKLQNFLDAEGRDHLKNPPEPSWTPADALESLAWVLHQPLPAGGGSG